MSKQPEDILEYAFMAVVGVIFGSILLSIMIAAVRFLWWVATV